MADNLKSAEYTALLVRVAMPDTPCASNKATHILTMLASSLKCLAVEDRLCPSLW
ncbi:MAG: hypothetical protein Q4G13_09720 [Moraxella sp.]|nr:hypothetical protein [Moraxella sp.]